MLVSAEALLVGWPPTTDYAASFLGLAELLSEELEADSLSDVELLPEEALLPLLRA